MKKTLSTLLFLSLSLILTAATHHVGTGQAYPTLSAAVAITQPGDTILIHGGTYAGGLSITNLKGTAGQWITIQNGPGGPVIFEGGGNAIQFVEPAYLHIIGLIFQHQTGNGVNTDDGGTYATPAHHVVFENCVFRDMSANGNNDLLKLSGLDFFEIRNCEFVNGSAGGSGIDMVGCHHGIIQGNYFENLGSNSIQCKGGTEHIRIEGNFFKNGGQRTLNLGGSTGLQFFRPDTAHFEAACIQVYSNIIVGSWAPIAYVGAVEVEVVNNTIYRPQNWVIRILQETVDPSRFLECGNNSFRNNIVFLGNNLSTETNIGPNTRPESFVFSNNLWYNIDDSNWSGPFIPVVDSNNILNADPLLFWPDQNDFSIPTHSPAAGAGLALSEPSLDFSGHGFAIPPSIGAMEANPVSALNELGEAALQHLKVYPNPASNHLWVEYELLEPTKPIVELYDLMGRRVSVLPTAWQTAGLQRLLLPLNLTKGIYFLRVSSGKTVAVQNILVH
ncbi:MAG: T9SS type A sorting domain-containing protein [Saprospiraceae bacterium]|nr:T9SS type A sorting domain-containing protein [Saprospiraceae bacterium]